MNKLLQTTLVSAIMATSGFASGDIDHEFEHEVEKAYVDGIPTVIEPGATVCIDRDIKMGQNPITIENYGSITMEIEEEPYPKLIKHDYNASVVINNHVGQELKEITDEERFADIVKSNPVTDVTNAYEIKTANGYINPNFDIDPDITVNTVTESDLDFKSLTNTDLLYLGTDKDGETIKLTHDNAGPSTGAAQIKYHIGDQGAKHSYGLELDGALSMDGNISNYRNGSIKITENAGIRFYYNGEIHVPMTIDGSAIFYESTDIYKDVTVSGNGKVWLSGEKTTLKSGATWKICAKTDLTTE